MRCDSDLKVYISKTKIGWINSREEGHVSHLFSLITQCLGSLPAFIALRTRKAQQPWPYHGGASRYDVRIRGESWKSRRSKGYYYKSVPNPDKGEGVKKSENFADVINGCSLA